MARQPTGNPSGRPPKEINWSEFEKLCEIQCTQSEIASIFNIHRETLNLKISEHYGEDFPTIYKKYSEVGKSSLRRTQFKLAQKNTSMAIWLGKQWLGQKDHSKEDIQDIAKDLRNAIRESEAGSGTHETQGSAMEAQQPILDQGFSGQENQIQGELGSTRTLCESP